MKISLKFVPEGPINKIPALVEIMTWRRPGDKPLSEPMMVRLLTHICVTRPQWVKTFDHVNNPEQPFQFDNLDFIDWFIMAKFKNNLIICWEMNKIYIGCKYVFIYYLYLLIYLFIISYLFLISQFWILIHYLLFNILCLTNSPFIKIREINVKCFLKIMILHQGVWILYFSQFITKFPFLKSSKLILWWGFHQFSLL